MKNLTSILAGAALIALAPGVAAADSLDLSFAVHDIVVTSNIPIVNISVRNLSPSPDPAMRNLRVTSPTPALNVSGQVWCKSFQHAQTRADAAQIMYGNASLATSPNGADILPLGTWSSSPVVQLGGDETLRNFAINAPINFPDHWNGGITLNFNPVHIVEERLQQYVQNGAGSAADFLRVDDVFVTTIKMNAVGWCEYDTENGPNRRYAGYRQIDVQVHIFYHGDPDIQDQPAVGVGSGGTVQAPPSGRGPSYAPPTGRPGRDTPPRRARPSRQGGGDVDRPDPAPQAASDMYLKIPDIDGESGEALIVPAVQRQQDQEEESRAPRADDEAGSPSAGAGSALGDTIRREAARAAVGLLLGSVRAPTGSSARAQPARPAPRPGRPPRSGQ